MSQKEILAEPVSKLYYTSKEDQEKGELMEKWKLLSEIEKRVDNTDRQYNAIKIKKGEGEHSISLIRMQKCITFTSAFVKCTVLASMVYKKSYKKKIYNIGKLRIILEYAQKNPVIARELSIDWIPKSLYTSHEALLNIASNGIIQDILLGKITNEKKLIKKYLSIVVKRKNLPINQIINLGYEKTVNNFMFRQSLRVCKEPYEGLLNNLHKIQNGEDRIIFDLIELAFQMKRKINFNWSEKRIKEEHDKLSNEVTAIKVKLLSETTGSINYKGEFPKIEGIEILSNIADIYEEAQEMKHCLYSRNYFSIAEQKRTLLMSLNHSEYRGTAY